MKPEAQKFDVSLQQYLQEQGVSTEAIRLISANLNGSSIDRQSALHMARVLAIFGSSNGPSQFVKGGSQRMTDAMAGALKSDIITDAPVAVIEDEGDGVEITLADGRKFGARQVICTIPFAALRSIRIDAALPVQMRTVIDKLPYTRASFAFLQASEPFWRSDGFPETLWSDDAQLGRVYVLGDDPALLKVWLNGESADWIDQADPQVSGAAIIAKVEAARPSAAGKLKLLRTFSWQNNPFARAVYHNLGTGLGTALA